MLRIKWLASGAAARGARVGVCWILLAGWTGLSWPAAAQDAATQDAPATETPAAPPKVIHSPRDVEFLSKDGVRLMATYYASTKGKDAATVICLHGYKGNRHDFASLATYLQQEGHAVLTLDLRAHGDSTSVEGFDRKLDPDTLPIKQYEQMVFDVEAAKRFLLERNNAAELNIEKLCVVGAEMGAAVATNWAVVDWSWPDYGSIKQGRDVKALVLISPEFRFKSLTVNKALTDPVVRDRLSIYLVMGKSDNHYLREAERMFSQLERYRKDRMETPDRDLFLDRTMDTSLQGTKLLGEQSLGLERNIGKFIELRLVSKSHPWSERRLAP